MSLDGFANINTSTKDICISLSGNYFSVLTASTLRLIISVTLLQGNERNIETDILQSGHRGFFPGRQTVPCALGSTQTLK